MIEQQRNKKGRKKKKEFTKAVIMVYCCCERFAEHISLPLLENNRLRRTNKLGRNVCLKASHLCPETAAPPAPPAPQRESHSCGGDGDKDGVGRSRSRLEAAPPPDVGRIGPAAPASPSEGVFPFLQGSALSFGSLPETRLIMFVQSEALNRLVNTETKISSSPEIVEQK